MKKGQQVAKDVLEKGWGAFDFKTMAAYDAVFPGRPLNIPYLTYIQSFEEKQGYAYVALHHFLERVGKDNVFILTKMSPEGEKFFRRLIDLGILEIRKDLGDTKDYSYVLKLAVNPRENLRAYSEAFLDPPQYAPRAAAQLIQ